MAGANKTCSVDNAHLALDHHPRAKAPAIALVSSFGSPRLPHAHIAQTQISLTFPLTRSKLAPHVEFYNDKFFETVI